MNKHKKAIMALTMAKASMSKAAAALYDIDTAEASQHATEMRGAAKVTKSWIAGLNVRLKEMIKKEEEN